MLTRSLANFVDIGRVPQDMGVGFLKVSIVRLRSAVTEPVEVPPCYPLNATRYVNGKQRLEEKGYQDRFI